MRDARINQIGEGANDVLRAFIAMVGIKPVADQFLKVKDALSHPITRHRHAARLRRQADRGPADDAGRAGAAAAICSEHAHELGGAVRDFGLAVQRMLMKHREAILFRQYVQERLADAACELYASSCTLSRLDHLLTVGNGNADGGGARRDGRALLPALANRRIQQCLAALYDNDDAETTATADAMLARY